MAEILAVFKKEIAVILLAAAPISELRGAIPVGISLGFSPIHSMILSIIGNMIPVPLLLIILEPVFDYLEKTIGFRRIVKWIKKRTLRRSEKIRKYKILGLFLLVAIPLPTTGAWTGAIAASLFNFKFKEAFLAIFAGVITAGIIIVILSTQATWLIELLSLKIN